MQIAGAGGTRNRQPMSIFRSIMPADGIRAGNLEERRRRSVASSSDLQAKAVLPSLSKWGGEIQRTIALGPETACPGLDPGLTDFAGKVPRREMSRFASVLAGQDVF
jgi:hypothetical protein